MRKTGKSSVKSFKRIEQFLDRNRVFVLRIARVYIAFFTLPQIDISNMDVRKCLECVDKAQQSNAQLQDFSLKALKYTCM